MSPGIHNLERCFCRAARQEPRVQSQKRELAVLFLTIELTAFKFERQTQWPRLKLSARLWVSGRTQ